jgi:hypothetical protein
MNNTRLKQVSEHVALGVTITDKLTWTSHIQRICEKGQLRLNILKSLGAKLPRATKIQIFKTFIRPVLEYGNVLYANAPFRDLQLLDAIQRGAALACTRAYRSTETVQLYFELGWDSLAVRRKIHQSILLFKVIKCNVSPYLYALLPTTGNDGRGPTLRNQNKYKLYKCRTAKFRSSFFPSGIKLWNLLPLNIQGCPSINSFKRTAIRHFGIAPSRTPHIKHCRGAGSVFHGRLRMGLSALNQHRFTYNFIPSRNCEKCENNVPESTKHYFLECPAYAVQRLELLREISQTLPALNFDQLTSSKKIDILLLKSADIKNTPTICHAVHAYLVNSQRF